MENQTLECFHLTLEYLLSHFANAGRAPMGHEPLLSWSWRLSKECYKVHVLIIIIFFYFEGTIDSAQESLLFVWATQCCAQSLLFALRNHSWQTLGIIWGAGDCTWVCHVQSKCPTC